MEEVNLTLDENQEGRFHLEANGELMGEMYVSITGNVLTAHHTEVAPAAQGKGVAKLLLNAMVDYVRERHMKVNPLCPYVHAQFKKNPEVYADIWKKERIG
jgi:predicted GNAT family acetyltransferase